MAKKGPTRRRKDPPKDPPPGQARGIVLCYLVHIPSSGKVRMELNPGLIDAPYAERLDFMDSMIAALKKRRDEMALLPDGPSVGH